ncbi:MAG TPA: M23 family metallopeptidase [Polyangia bacterium]|jgi:murein DD-endopeptidase MepM/ murein hydrolase activator NlpD|nr:M23 family metallopeptidase [Polyangia bacterium]
MVDVADTIQEYSDACEACGSALGARRFLNVDGSALHSFCSESCLRTGLVAQSRRRWRARRRGMKIAVIGVAVAGACLAPHEVRVSRRPAPPVRAAAALPGATGATGTTGTTGSSSPTVPAGWFGPEWPPTETSVLATLGRDAWIHPLAGPVRRMPLRDSRVFGAIRPGNRAIECRNGHCGVDLGGEIWGEHVRAAHDGVVDFVQRGANAQHGGEFVRIAHRGGTVFTQYFHLAAIPRWIERGTFVKSGDLIGLVGDTGVKESAPHLHFAVSIRPSPERAAERYIDPEPLIALWPLRVPLEDSPAGLVTTLAEPGLPLGSAPLIPGRKRKLAQMQMRKAAAASAGSAASEAPAADDGPAESAGGSDSAGDD